ncbi:MAG: hypothetical protein ACTSWY_07360 [Promethearchaeota archaeon]
MNRQLSSEGVPELNLYIQKINKYSPLLAFLLCFILGILFILTPYWQLAIMAGVIGGILCTEMKWGAISGFAGILISWGAGIWYQVITNHTNVLLNQIADIILGSESLGGIFLLIILLIGALMGALGGSMGSGIRILIELRKKSHNTVDSKNIE